MPKRDRVISRAICVLMLPASSMTDQSVNSSLSARPCRTSVITLTTCSSARFEKATKKCGLVNRGNLAFSNRS
ncbi:hypothetical protein, partial [Actinokineospora sp.]|uniref:hypothetical protein n=1 Tax=Actinokineospora sp. TaxID=1872133 RepID=UPI003D6A3F3B